MPGYTRAFIDRARAKSGEPLRFVAATEGRKADGIDLRMTGARLERFRANPVVLYGHRYFERDSLPIGKATSVDVEHGALVTEVEFDQGDEFARNVERKYREGFLNAVSIGFNVLEWESPNDDYYRGGVATGWELVEVSAVPVPMDPSAVVESGRAALRSYVADLGERVGAIYVATPLSEPDVERIARKVFAELAPGTEMPGESQPGDPASDVAEAALRQWLAALELPKENNA